jgi:hypothetical protein
VKAEEEPSVESRLRRLRPSFFWAEASRASAARFSLFFFFAYLLPLPQLKGTFFDMSFSYATPPPNTADVPRMGDEIPEVEIKVPPCGPLSASASFLRRSRSTSAADGTFGIFGLNKALIHATFRV